MCWNKWKFKKVVYCTLGSTVIVLENKIVTEGNVRCLEHKVPAVYRKPKVSFAKCWLKYILIFYDICLEISQLSSPMTCLPMRASANILFIP